MQRFETLDWIVIGIYFLLIAALAIWAMTRKQKNTEDYFLAGRNLGWFVVGASIFASNIGSEHVVGLAGAGAGGKIPMLIYELHAWLVITLGWVFLPFYMRSGVFTTPEFLERTVQCKHALVPQCLFPGGVCADKSIGNCICWRYRNIFNFGY